LAIAFPGFGGGGEEVFFADGENIAVFADAEGL
jgi:hypothetical protein